MNVYYRNLLIIWLLVFLVVCSISSAEAQKLSETIVKPKQHKNKQTAPSSLRKIAFYNYNYNRPWDELRLDTLIVRENDKNLRLTITPKRLDDSLSIWEGRVHAYTFEMRLLKGNRILFDKTLTLKDFNMLEKEACSFPKFVHYQPKYDQLIFEQSFFRPETDAGSLCFYTMKTDGTVHLFGGEIRDYSDNYEYVLTKERLYGLDGSSFSFFPAMKNLFINDSCFIVINWPFRDENNAIIHNVEGEKLLSFRFDGFVMRADYEPLIGRLKELSQVVLFDNKIQNVRVITSNDPLNHIIYPVSEITEYKADVTKEALIALTLKTNWYKKYYHFYFNSNGELVAYSFDN